MDPVMWGMCNLILTPLLPWFQNAWPLELNILYRGGMPAVSHKT